MRDADGLKCQPRHARIELRDGDYQRLKRAAGWLGLPVAAFIRMAVLERVAGDERERGIWSDHLGGLVDSPGRGR